MRAGVDEITLTHWPDADGSGAVLKIVEVPTSGPSVAAMALLTPETAKVLYAALGAYLADK